MKRDKFIKYLDKQGCILYREGGNHTVFLNPKTNKVTAIPRHREIDDIFCNDICKQLGIPKIK